MAWHMKLKLPKFKVTQIGETTTHRSVPRGRRERGPELNQTCLLTSDIADANDLQQSNNVVEPSGSASLYAIKQKASASAWDQMRQILRTTAIESCALPTDQGCILCTSSATHRCTHCGAWAYYCSHCFSQAHSLTNFFHVGEVWEVSNKNSVLVAILSSWL